MTDPADPRPGQWPLLGRHDVVDAALTSFDTAARGGRAGGVLLVGPAGIGKSAVADAIAREAGTAGVALERLVAGANSTTVPLLWLAPLNEIPGSARSRDALVADVERTIRRRSPDTPLLLVVDDIHLLGGDDLDLLAALVRRRALFLVATARPTNGGIDPIRRLLADGWIARIELALLDRRTLVAAAEQYLDAPLTPATAERLATASGGVPLFARELVMVNLDAGILTEHDGRWHLDERAVIPPSLVELLADRYVGLDEARRLLLEVLAVAQPLPIDALELDGTLVIEALAELEDLGLIEAREAQGSWVLRLAHPLYAEAILSRCGPLRRRALIMRGLRALEHLPEHDPDRDLRIVTFCLEHGLDVSDRQRLIAAARALRLLDPALCLRLVGGIDANAWETAFLRGSALAFDGRVDEADHVLTEAFELARDDEQRARTTSRHAGVLTSRAARHDDALAVLDRARSRIDDPNWQAFLDADRAYVLLAVGRAGTTDTSATIAAIGPARANECFVGAVVAAMDGRGAAAEALVAEGLSLVHHLVDDIPSARELLILSRFIWLATAGRAEEAAAIVEAELDRAGGIAAHEGPWLAADALRQLLDGDAPRAAATADGAITALAEVDVAGVGPMALATRASALAELGRTQAARAVLEMIDPAWRNETKTRLLIARTEAWLLARSGSTRRAASIVAAAAQEALDGRHAPFALIGAHDAARLGHPSVALPVLRSAAERCEGRLAPALVEHAVALGTGDAAALLRLADELPRLGFTLSGAEAATAAADRLDAARRSIEAVHARALAGRLVERLGPVRSPVLGRIHTLTEREREIAELAARRHRSREIADLLGISVRTVDNHLVTVYRKLGISGRRELTRHLLGRGAPSGPDQAVRDATSTRPTRRTKPSM